MRFVTYEWYFFTGYMVWFSMVVNDEETFSAHAFKLELNF